MVVKSNDAGLHRKRTARKRHVRRVAKALSYALVTTALLAPAVFLGVLLIVNSTGLWAIGGLFLAASGVGATLLWTSYFIRRFVRATPPRPQV